MNKQYILMCQKCNDIQSFWKPKVGDWVSVVWNDPTLGGLESPRKLQNNPVYGLHWSNDRWYLNNGLYGNEVGKRDTFRHCSIPLVDHDPCAKVVWYPSLSQLTNILEKYKLNLIDI